MPSSNFCTYMWPVGEKMEKFLDRHIKVDVTKPLAVHAARAHTDTRTFIYILIMLCNTCNF